VLYQNLRIEKDRIVGVGGRCPQEALARESATTARLKAWPRLPCVFNYIRPPLRSSASPQQAVEELWARVEELARRTTKEIRHMLFHPAALVLETQGLLAALQQLAEKMKDTHDTTCSSKASRRLKPTWNTNAQGVLFYIIEEAVNNARKHAQSEHIWVRLGHRASFVVVEIEDDGVRV